MFHVKRLGRALCLRDGRRRDGDARPGGFWDGPRRW